MKKALVLSLAVVLGLGVASFAQTLSGSWDTTISINPGPPVTLGIDSELIVTYAVSGWSFTSDTVLDETGWLGQSFEVGGSLGAFTLGSVVVFDTVLPFGFTSWEVTGGLSLAGVTFDMTFASVPGDVALEIVAAGSAGAVDVEVDVTFGSAYHNTTGWHAGDELGICDFDWAGVDITVGFPFCCADVVSTISFDCLGFNYAQFKVTDIAIPALPWVTLDATLKFEMQTKSLVLAPKFDFGAVACFDLYITQSHTDAVGGTTGTDPGIVGLLGDIALSGIGLSCEIGGVEFTGISYWGTGTKPGLLYGTSYWEAYQIATTDDGCCGPFNFDVTLYFLNGGLQLFDVAEIDANMSIQIATQFTFSTGIAIDLTTTPSFTNWTIGFLVEW
jgi:hypothetical protein